MSHKSMNVTMCCTEAITKTFNKYGGCEKQEMMVYQEDVFICTNNVTKMVRLEADAVSRLLRYDNNLPRILDRGQLMEEGRVTKEDEEETSVSIEMVRYTGVDCLTKAH